MDATLTRSTMKNLTRYLGLAAKLLVFLLVLGFALKNSHSVTFNSYLDYVWQAPLIVMLGLAFMLGALMGVLALLPTVFRLRRELSRKPQAFESDTVTQTTDMPVI
jgi:putative membrane protein